MTETELKSSIEKIFEDLVPRVYQVLEVFNHYYGEDLVHLDMETNSDIISNVVLNIRAESTYSLSFNPELRRLIQNSVPRNAYLKDFPSEITSHRGFSDLISTLISEKIPIYIYVLWPEVTIRNESNRSHIIRELYARVRLDIDGTLKGYLGFCRGLCTEVELRQNYTHSHVSGLAREARNAFELSVCTGSGPINQTMSYLGRDFDLDRWAMFCYELDKYTQVESLNGGPYNRMEGMSGNGRTSTNPTKCTFDLPIKKPFETNNPDFNHVKFHLDKFFSDYVIENPPLLKYEDGQYKLAIPYVDMSVRLSNAFIQYINQHNQTDPNQVSMSDLINSTVMFQGNIQNGRIMSIGRSNGTSHLSGLGTRLFDFKGHPVTLRLHGEIIQSNNYSLFLSHQVMNYLIGTMLLYINTQYAANT